MDEDPKPSSSRLTCRPSDGRGEAKNGMLGQEALTITMLARWAETSAYTPPEEPTTGAVMSATDTAKDPGNRQRKKSIILEAGPYPSHRPSDAAASGVRPQGEVSLEPPRGLIYGWKNHLIQTSPFTDWRTNIQWGKVSICFSIQPLPHDVPSQGSGAVIKFVAETATVYRALCVRHWPNILHTFSVLTLKTAL